MLKYNFDKHVFEGDDDDDETNNGEIITIDDLIDADETDEDSEEPETADYCEDFIAANK